MCNYLLRRGSTYYFRRVIPKHLQAFLKRSEWTFSLGTKDPLEGKKLAQLEGVRTNRIIEDAEDAMGAEVSGLGALELPTAMTEAQQEEADFAALMASEAAGRHRARKPDRDTFRRRMTLGTGELTRTEQVARDLLRQRDREVAELEERIRILDYNSMAGVARTVAVGTFTAQEPTMLDTTIIDLWAGERKVQRKGVDTHRAVARWFYDRTGTKAVDQITRSDVLAFKTKLLEEGQTAANVKMKLSRLRTLLQWAFVNDYAPLNAAQGIEIRDTEAAKNKRRPFDLLSLNAIFASPVYVSGDRPTQGRGEAAYWLPLLALFTGARLEELGQLRPEDVQRRTYLDADDKEQAAWFLHLVETADEGGEGNGTKLKNAASERLVPVHSQLERLGFIAFCESVKAQGRPRLFHLLKPNKYGFLAAKWGEWWSGYRRTVCGVTDRRMVFHSFRHTFIDYARHVSIGESLTRQLTGHGGEDVHDDYGSGYSLHRLVEGMKLYKVPGLKLPLKA